MRSECQSIITVYIGNWKEAALYHFHMPCMDVRITYSQDVASTSITTHCHKTINTPTTYLNTHTHTPSSSKLFCSLSSSASSVSQRPGSLLRGHTLPPPSLMPVPVAGTTNTTHSDMLVLYYYNNIIAPPTNYIQC